MTFTTTPPTTPGFYVARHKVAKYESLADVYQAVGGNLAVAINGYVGELKEFGEYEWCRLVPAEEVEKAFYEGWSCDGVLYPYVQCWNDSHAKQVAEGKI